MKNVNSLLMKGQNWKETLNGEMIFRLQEKREHIGKCLSLLTEEELWWKHNDSLNSVSNLILHVCGNIRQYIIAGMGGDEDVRERQVEFSTDRGYDKSSLWQLFSLTIDKACEVVNELTKEELLSTKVVQGFTFSGVGIILHAVEHLSYHTGQIAYMTKQIKDQQLNLYGDFDLEVKNEGG